MSGHIHAELMAQYAEDAKNTTEPWIFWEYFNGDKWLSLRSHPRWTSTIKYRRKVNPIEIKKIVRHGEIIGDYHCLSVLTPGDRVVTFREVIED